MPKAVAFFPWVSIAVPQVFGPLRLLPYKAGKLPGNLLHADQADVDVILKAYAEHPGRRVTAATLVELGDWQTGMDCDRHSPALLAVREIVAFAALANRQLFSVCYANTDTYKLVIQEYQAGNAARFVFRTRRRDGFGAHLWSNDSFAFQRPSHVDAASFLVDTPLLSALMGMDPVPQHWRNAIADYCGANTDASDMPDHSEAVLSLCAFEWLFQFTGANVEHFVSALHQTFPPATGKCDGPLFEAWQRYRKPKRHPDAIRPLEAWAREFCQVRNQSAHGQSRKGDRFVWSMRTHLAFASMLFPLAFKAVLASHGAFELSHGDTRRVAQIDEYLLYDPFAFDFQRSDREAHPWNKLEQRARLHALAKAIQREREEQLARTGSR